MPDTSSARSNAPCQAAGRRQGLAAEPPRDSLRRPAYHVSRSVTDFAALTLNACPPRRAVKQLANAFGPHGRTNRAQPATENGLAADIPARAARAPGHRVPFRKFQAHAGSVERGINFTWLGERHMVRKVEQRRVRGALDRFGPPFPSGGGHALNDADDESPAHPQAWLEVKRSYVRVRARVEGSSTSAQVRPAHVG